MFKILNLDFENYFKFRYLNFEFPCHARPLPNLGVGFPLICFQRLSRPNIATRQCPWQEQPIHQRSVLLGPLVLEKTPLKQSRLQQIETNLSHACYHILLCALDYNIILIFRMANV